MTADIPHVVIIGGGFGGLSTARKLANKRARVTLIDRRNHHLFQPLLYQVATGGLSPANIAVPLRALFKGDDNVTTLLGDVSNLDLENRQVRLHDGEALDYDALVVAAGAGTSYFGHETEWQERAPSLKSIEDATKIRRRVLLAFEDAERTADDARRAAMLTFVIVGGGPTGVELAGAIAEVAYRTVRGEFRNAHVENTRVVLLEGSPRLLGAFHDDMSARARRDLEQLGVEVVTQAMVETIDDDGVRARIDGGELRIDTTNVFWAAGVRPSKLATALAEQSGAELDRAGRVIVESDCTLAGRPEVFVIGDMARFDQDDAPLPGLAPVAMQQGRYAAKAILARGQERPSRPFRYVDKGNMATIGRGRAVAEVGADGSIRFGGAFAWLAWLFIHLMYLTEFQNRILVLVQWGWNYVTRNRSARLITGASREGPY
ncbi:MAG: NAD(P)/FAD-dependent oxidoreductase [Acidobacteriota bacterium]